MPAKILTALAKFEAESHRSKGRVKDALDTYESLLSASPYMTLNTKMSIEDRMEILRCEVDDATLKDEDRNLEKAIKKYKNIIPKDTSAAALKKEARAFYNKGLYVDALEILKLLLIQGNEADEFCVKAVMGCLLHLHAKDNLAAALDLFLAETFQDSEKAAQFKTTLIENMVQMGYSQHAEILQKS